MKIHFKYFQYLVRHKWFVFVAGIKIGAPLWRLLIHDWSKFLPSEWIPYARYFYGTPWTDEQIARGERICCTNFHKFSKQYAEQTFNEAWNLHQKRNKHHWQYWYLVNDSTPPEPLLIPRKHLLEMVADWAGAGRAITGKWDVGGWYEKNKAKIQLAYFTRLNVEAVLRKHFPTQ